MILWQNSYKNFYAIYQLGGIRRNDIDVCSFSILETVSAEHWIPTMLREHIRIKSHNSASFFFLVNHYTRKSLHPIHKFGNKSENIQLSTILNADTWTMKLGKSIYEHHAINTMKLFLIYFHCNLRNKIGTEIGRY